MSRKRHPVEELFVTLIAGSDFSDDYTDRVHHIDVVTPAFTVDVKAMKRISYTDESPDPNIHWIEFQNISGNDGWLYGKADYIAFEQPDDFIMVKRKVLGKYCRDLMKDKSKEVITVKPTFKDRVIHQFYNRDKNEDIIILVNTAELVALESFRVSKKFVYAIED